MSISILIPAKNEESMIEECLASARWADEVIVLDNGSTDGTRDFLERLDPEKYHIRTIEYLPKNIGFAAGHNSLFRQAKGEFVFCLNQDVELGKNYLSEIIAFFVKNPRTGSAAGVLLQPRNEKRVDPSTALRAGSSAGSGMPSCA